MGSIETCTHYENNVSCTSTTGVHAEGGSPLIYGGFEGGHHRHGVLVHAEKNGGALITNSSTSITTDHEHGHLPCAFELGNVQQVGHESVPDFIKGGFDHWACSSGSILSFGTSTRGERSGSVLGLSQLYGGSAYISKDVMISEEEQEEEDDQYYCSGWAADHVMDHDKSYQWNSSNSNNVIHHLMNSSKCGAIENANNCFETASTGNYGTTLMKNGNKENQYLIMREAAERIEWLYSGSDTTTTTSTSTTTADNFPKSGGILLSHDEAVNHHQKRPYNMGAEEIQASKKHSAGTASTRSKPKLAKPNIPSKDPQSIAAKNRRERISERLKILQDLVPNGTKVDLVTMLEKAISYVKFLQLQVKVLATDEFWPAAGGKAPEVAQVKEAIEAILSSHRDRNSSSK